jgi:Tol biopolymer transport system component
MENQVRELLRDIAEDIPRQRQVPPTLRVRARRRIATTVGLTVAAVATLVLGSVVAVRSSTTSSIRPANGPTTSPSTPGSAGFYLLDLQTGEATRLPHTIDANEAGVVSISPDGTMVTYRGDDPQGPLSVVYVANIDGTNARPLEETHSLGGAWGPRWSPDGSQIVYQGRGLGLAGDLFLVDVAKGKTMQLTHLGPIGVDHHWYMDPTFSPEGQTILFTLPRGSHSWDLWSVPSTGGRAVLVRRDAADAGFSPDGTRIAYEQSHRDGAFLRGDIWLADADGSHARRLVQGDHLLWPRWSPDGTRIAYGDTSRGRNGETYVLDVKTGDTSKVADGLLAEWVDDHTLIVNTTICGGC